MQPLRRYVVLPAFGFRNEVLAQSEKLRSPGGLVRLSARPALRRGAAQPEDASTTMHVLDSTHEDGPKLVEMTPEAELNLRAEIPGLKVVPLVTYHTMRAEQEIHRPAKAEVSAETQSIGIKIRVLDAKASTGVPGAKVIAFTDYRNRAGDEGFTDGNGFVSLKIKPGIALDRIYIYGPTGYWGHYAPSLKAEADSTIVIDPINLDSDTLLLKRFYGSLPTESGAGITVGIVDTGIAKGHPLLPNVRGGVNMVFDEVRGDPGATDDWGPAATEGEHGTHVAGIVGARASKEVNLRGVAPGVQLRSYRVFPNSGGGATNYDIMSAIDRAVADGCHIVNLSLGGGTEDEAVRAAIGAALAAGTLVVAAAGNDYRKPVSFPATIDFCVAVAAMGRTGTFPPTSSEAAEVARPFGSDTANFFAAFSNFGPQIDLVGPGVGIVSTLPDNKYGVMSGTSMSCPAIVGFAAYLLGANPTTMQAAGNERTRMLKNLLYGGAQPFGFGRDYEGFGSPLLPITS